MSVTQEDLREWARAFNASLNCGTVMPLTQHLSDSIEQVRNEKLRDALKAVHSDIAQGNSLSGAMAEHPDVFDRNFITIVRYGEIHGEVDLTLQRFVERPEDTAPRCKLPATT